MSTFDSSTTLPQTVTLRDGRSLGYAEYGDPKGKPAFHFHGHPGSRLEGKLFAEAATKAGVRLIGIDRPGMGLSDFEPSRNLLDWPNDVVQLADALEIDRFGVEGVSGGGPYAAACAYKIPDRLTACGIAAGLGPIDLLGTEGMMTINRVQFFLAPRLPWLLRLLMWLFIGRNSRYVQDKEKMEEISLKFWQGMSEADREAMGHPDMGRLYMEEMLEAFRQGSKGPAYDARLYTQHWGFRLEDISLDKVYLWYGEIDVNVPFSMGRAMANAISNCKATFYPNETHISVIANHSDEIMEAMSS